MERRKFIADSAMLTAELVLLGGSNLLATEMTGNSVSRLRNYEDVSTTVLLKGKEVKVHGFCTGTVAVKTKFRTKKGLGELAKLNMVLDKQFTEFMPIWVWVIEHPDGLIVIDTGEIQAICDLDKFLANESGINRYMFKKLAKFDVSEKDELNYHFEKVNLKLDDVKLLALTHFHLDHTDGLKFFPKTEIIVNDFEFNHPYSNMPTTYPKWFNPNRVAFKANQIEIFDLAFPINNDLFYVPTPGHTLGHSSVVFKTDEFDIIFAGDTSYNQSQLLKGELAGVNQNYHQSKRTYSKLLSYASNRKTIYLPTHDENAGQRLADKTFLVKNTHEPS